MTGYEALYSIVNPNDNLDDGIVLHSILAFEYHNENNDLHASIYDYSGIDTTRKIGIYWLSEDENSIRDIYKHDPDKNINISNNRKMKDFVKKSENYKHLNNENDSYVSGIIPYYHPGICKKVWVCDSGYSYPPKLDSSCYDKAKKGCSFAQDACRGICTIGCKGLLGGPLTICLTKCRAGCYAARRACNSAGKAACTIPGGYHCESGHYETICDPAN